MKFYVLKGQRCTTLRRLMLPAHCYDEVLERMKNGAVKLIDRIGDPMDEQTLYGPMHNQVGVDLFKSTMEKVSGSFNNMKLHYIWQLLL